MNSSCSTNLSIMFKSPLFNQWWSLSTPYRNTHNPWSLYLLWQRAKVHNVSYGVSSQWKFNPCQLPWDQSLVFHFLTDVEPQVCDKLTFHSLTHLHKLTDVTFGKRFKTDYVFNVFTFFLFAFVHFAHLSIDIIAHLSACSGSLKSWNIAYKTLLESTLHKKLLMEDNSKKFKSGRGRFRFVSMINKFCFYCYYRLMFGIFFPLNLVLRGEGSSAAVPFTTLLALLAMW